MNPKGIYAPLNAVRLLDHSAFSDNMARDIRYLKYLDCDRMLYNFRKTFGIPTDAEPIFGWDAPDGLLRGHSTGHYLSALAIAYSASGDEELLRKLNYMITELHTLQKMAKGSAAAFTTVCTPEDCRQEKWSSDPSVWGEGFLSAYSPDQFALLEQFTRYANIWAPYYTLHKLIAGLVEAYDRTGNKEALETACGIGSWIYDRLTPLSAEHRRKMWSMYIAGEFGGMNETLARLYTITGEEKYLTCAKMFDNDNIFPGLAEGKDTFQNLHANQHIPQIMGAMLEYEACGDETYHNIAKHFFRHVTEHHMYAIGGVGQGECFRDPDSQARFIKGDTNCETCASYNLLKLARELYAFDPDNAVYMDYYERAMINHILASQNPRTTVDMKHGVTYMLPIGPGAKKEYSNDYRAFTCCHGTGMENHVKYPDAQYFLSGDTVAVNQYIPSVMDFNGIRIATDVSFPFGRGSITLSGSRDYTCRFRIPAWCNSNPFTDTDGNPLPCEGRYAVIRHTADSDTVVDVRFRYTVRFERTPDETDDGPLTAILYGPFVMVTCDPAKEVITVPADTEFRAEINREAGAFCITGAGRIFVPIYKVHGRPYHTYFRVK